MSYELAQRIASRFIHIDLAPQHVRETLTKEQLEELVELECWLLDEREKIVRSLTAQLTFEMAQRMAGVRDH